MASLTIRNIPEDAKRRFREVAAAHGRSMEEHLRQLIIGEVEGASSVSVRERRTDYVSPAPSNLAEDEEWVDELVRIANGAGEGVFDREPQQLREFDL
ncbi:MAG TPA: hypothetical protein VIT45_13215 [Allosphingosinicella sp.]